MTWKPYSAYKDIGIEWFGDTPAHWESKRLKYCVSLINEKVDGSHTELQYTGLENIESWTGRIIPSEEQKISEGQPTLFKSGDVLFCKLRPYLAKVLRATSEGICTGELLVLRPKTATQDYLFYYLLARDFISIVDSSTYGAKMPRANWEFIGNLPMLRPPFDEQKAIATFLDRETQRIDNLIAKKERQIELLQEKRTALLSQAVTKGLNPNVKMKDSAIEWLGMIPEHWSINRAKVLFREVNERSSTGEEELLTVSHITGVTRRSEKNVTMFMAESLEDYKKCKVGDLVINTMWAWMGAMGITPESGIVSPSYNVYRFRSNDYEPWFYDCLFRTGKFVAEVICHSQGVWTSRLRLYPEEFFEIRLPCPPLEEQREIVAAIRKEIGNYDILQRKVEQSIENLREYRSALISAAVTGKIDVRKVASV
jgi:type I restriction enzyme S subunit